MAAALAAAHIGHEIEHSAAMMGFLLGAAAGLAVGALVVAATVATGGAALAVVAAVGGAMAATGGGALAGKYIGEAVTSPKGPISSGSPNVFYGAARLPAARAIIDSVACKDHGLKFLATGSDSVFLNEYPAVRDQDKSECDGTVGSTIDHVFIGAETVQYLEISPEVPEWMVNVALGMAIVGGTVALVFGAAAAASAAGICGLIQFGGSALGGMVGAAIMAPLGGTIGEAIGGELGKRIGETAGGFLGGLFGGGIGNRIASGHPVDVATGELFTAQTDFIITGILSLAWERFWISSSTHHGALGAKWHHPLDMALSAGEGCTILRISNGRLILLPLLSPGQSFYHRAEKLTARHEQDGTWTIRQEGGQICHLAAHASDPSTLRLHRIADDNDNRITLEYDDEGNLGRVTGTDGICYLFAHDSKGRISSIDKLAADRQVRLVSYDYDPAGNLIAATDRSTLPFCYDYQHHLLTRETQRSGLSFYFEWDDPALKTAARCIKTWGDGNLYYRELRYSPDARQTQAKSFAGAVEHYTYNEIGLVTAITTPLGAESFSAYNRFAEIESATDPNGAITRWTRDNWGRVVGLTDRDGATTRYAYASDAPDSPRFQALTVEIDPLGGETTATYDQRGNLTAYSDASGHHMRILRDARGLPLNLQDSEGTVERLSWDAQGNLRRHYNATGDGTRYEYDVFGRLIRETADGLDPIDYSHDAQDRITGINQSDGTSTGMTYDAHGRMIAMRQPDGATYRWDYGGLPDPIRRINPDGTVFHYDYDSELNLIRLINEQGDEYRLEYDSDQHLIAETGFDGRHQSFAYDRAGHLIQASDGPRRHEFTRDATGRLLRRDSSDGEWASFSYDAAGQLLSADNPARQLRFAYDPRGKLLSETQDGHQTSHAYSARGALMTTLLPDGRLIGFGYDRDGAFDRLSFDGQQILTLQRDRLGREVMRNASGLNLQTDYDPQGRIRHQMAYRNSRQNPGNSRQNPVFGRSYSHDRAGLIQQIADIARGTQNYHYDQRQQLRRATSPDGTQTFAFDPAGHILADVENLRDASVRQGRLLMRGDQHYDYDDAGNRISLRQGCGGAHRHDYRYDAMNQLTEVHETRGRTRRKTCFAYDALGRRISKSHREVLIAANLPAAPGSTSSSNDIAELVREDTTWFLWNGNVLLAEAKGDAQGAPDPTAVVYIFEPNSFLPAAQIRRHSAQSEDEVLIYWVDHLGTPQEMTNQRGELVWQVALKAWGGIDRVLVGRVENNIRFQGQYHDIETGLHYNRFRHYDPAAGCFINPDPIGLAGGEVPARYALNPLHWIDPFGLTPWDDFRAKNKGEGLTQADMSREYRKTDGYQQRHAPSTSTHGNSLSSTRPAMLYALVDKNGNFQKWGITQEVGNPHKRYGNTIPRTWDILEIEVGSRADMARMERRLYEKMPGRMNDESTSGKYLGQKLTPDEHKRYKTALSLGCKF